MRCHLFVYGTLMASAVEAELGRAERQRLAREGENLGDATMAGCLYDLGRYPGLVGPSKPADVVHGELIALADPAHSFAWLDAYEGIAEDGAAADAYERVLRPVRLLAGRDVEAWVYLYRGDVRGTQRRPDGRWPVK